MFNSHVEFLLSSSLRSTYSAQNTGKEWTASSLLGLTSCLLIVKYGQNLSHQGSIGIILLKKCLKTGMNHTQIIQTPCRNKLVMNAEGACRRCIVEIQVKVKYVLRMDAQLFTNDILEHVSTLQFIVHNTNDGQHILLLAELYTIIHLAVEMNGQIAYLQQRTSHMQQAGDGMQSVAATNDDSSGKTQWTVEPCAHDGATIYLGVQFGDASLTEHLGMRLDTECGRITMSTYQTETCLAKWLSTYAKSVERGIVFGNEELAASWDFP